jgi:hypothetical protein
VRRTFQWLRARVGCACTRGRFGCGGHPEGHPCDELSASKASFVPGCRGARQASEDQGDRHRRALLGGERGRRDVGGWNAAALEAIELQRGGVAWRVTAPRPARHLRTRAAGSGRRRRHLFRSMALAGVCTRDSVEADVPGSARRGGVVGANDASRRRSRRNSALASLSRRPSRPPPTPEARDRIHVPRAPRRQRSTRGVRHRCPRKPQWSVETARSKRGPVAQAVSPPPVVPESVRMRLEHVPKAGYHNG